MVHNTQDYAVSICRRWASAPVGGSEGHPHTNLQRLRRAEAAAGERKPCMDAGPIMALTPLAAIMVCGVG